MSANVEELVRILQRLVDDIGDRADADLEAFREAYTLGFEAGCQVGRLRLEHELAELDRRRTGHVADMATYAELEARRWDGRREDFGRPRPGDFSGAGRRTVSPRRPRSRPTAGR